MNLQIKRGNKDILTFKPIDKYCRLNYISFIF